MRRYLRVSVLTGIVTLSLVAAAFAQAPGAGMRARGGRHMRMGGGGAMAQLDLTAEQRQQLQTLRNEMQKSRQEAMVQMQKLQQQLRNEIFADQGPTGAVDTIARQIGELEASMLQARIQHQEQISKLLTPEQRQKARTAAATGKGFGGWR